MKGRLKPFLGADAALETERVRVGPTAELENLADCGCNVFGIGIAFLHQAHGQAVGAEENVNARGIVEVLERQVDLIHQRLNVERMGVEALDGARTQAAVRETAVPFLEAAQSGGEGVVGIERQEDQRVRGGGGDARDGLDRKSVV